MKLAYRSDIDGLRAVAVLSVVGFHAFPRWFKGGYVGVDIFFVISGFLISSIIFQGLKNNNFDYFEFYEKRIRRIFPALLVVLIFCLALGWFILFPQEYKKLGKYTLGSAGFISNLLLWHDTGYFDNAANTNPLLHLWSLGIEEQFYLIWPLLIGVLWKNKFNLFKIIILLGLLSFITNIIGIHFFPTATFYSPITRFWELLTGSLLSASMLFNNGQNRTGLTNAYILGNLNNRLSNLCAFTGFFIILSCIFLFSNTLAFPGAWAALPVIGTLLIVKGGTKSWLNRTLLSNRLLVWVGLISYPLYLWHWPLLSFAHILEEGTPDFIIRLSIVGIAIILSWLTYQLIEKPIRYRAVKYNSLPGLISLMLVIACGGIYLQWFNLDNSRFKGINPNLMALVSHPMSSPKVQFSCENIPEFNKFQFNGLCALSKKAEPDIMFIGDSHTWQYQSAVWKQLSLHSVLMIAEVSCLPFSSNRLMNNACKDKYNAIISYLESNTSIKKIYLSGYWAYLMSGGFEKEKLNWRQPKSLSTADITSFIANGHNFLSKIIKTNKEIILFKDIPDLDFNINTCFKLRPFSLHALNKDCAMSYEHYKQRNLAYNAVLDKLLKPFPQIRIYNPISLFCDKNQCFARDESLPYYFNGDHLNRRGADLVINDMLNKGLG